MAIVKPFTPIRPKEEFAQDVVAPPYDVLNRDEALMLAKNQPYSFLHVSRSEIDLPEIEDPHTQIVYQKAKDNLANFVADGVLIREEKPCYYIYEQSMQGRTQTGLVATFSIDEYLDNTIKKHELTLVEKEKDRLEHFYTCSAHTEPVFLTYHKNDEIQNIIDSWTDSHNATFNFTSQDGVGHKLWVLDDTNIINSIQQLFQAVPALYIADGHHRSASAAKVGLRRREESPNYDGSEEFNFFLAVLFPQDQLIIYDYNRVVADLNGLNSTEFLEKLSDSFTITSIGKKAQGPKSLHEFSMYLDGCWYNLKFKIEKLKSDDIVDELDVSILQNFVLQPILGIEDPRTDKRIDFIGGIRGLLELEKRVEKDMAVAFALYPPTMDNLLDIADANRIMPPKSTWFEPKLGSGLFVHEF